MSVKDLKYLSEAWEGMNSTPVETDQADNSINVAGWTEAWADILSDASLDYVIENFELVCSTLKDTLTDEYRYRNSSRD